MYISKDIKDRLVDALITAFVFAAALSWRDTLVELVQLVLPTDTAGVWSELIVTLGITAIVVALVYTLIKSNQVIDHRLGLDADEQEGPEERRRQKERRANE